jgi:hypothetical protein
VWFWTIRRGFSWFSMLAGLVVPIFVLELVLTHPTYRQNFATFMLLYLAAGALPLVVSIPLAIKYRYWRSIPWLPTWFAYAFLRRLATLEAVISLPTRPFPAQSARPTERAARRIRPELTEPRESPQSAVHG